MLRWADCWKRGRRAGVLTIIQWTNQWDQLILYMALSRGPSAVWCPWPTARPTGPTSITSCSTQHLKTAVLFTSLLTSLLLGVTFQIMNEDVLVHEA